MFLASGATNSRTHGPINRYAGMYEAALGRYAIYKRTVDEAGDAALHEGGEIVRRALP